MKLLVPTHHSRAIARIGDALALYAPAGSEVVRPETVRKDSRRGASLSGESDADVIVMLVNGLRDHFLAQAERCRRRGQKYAVVQIALRTTRHPSTEQWRELWRGATVVWSYYPLDLWIKEDRGARRDFPLHLAPLGVDGSVFTTEPAAQRYVDVLTSGARRNQESVAECDDAVLAVGGTLCQLGPELRLRSRAMFRSNLSDADLAALYRRCHRVSGLRRHEGFELPAAEGLLCGARPVLYDRPHYRLWYGDWADYVAERDAASVTRDLTELFQRGPRPVSVSELTEAANMFSWPRVVRGFWEMVRG